MTTVDDHELTFHDDLSCFPNDVHVETACYRHNSVVEFKRKNYDAFNLVYRFLDQVWIFCWWLWRGLNVIINDWWSPIRPWTCQW